MPIQIVGLVSVNSVADQGHQMSFHLNFSDSPFKSGSQPESLGHSVQQFA
jgi:hypothetical protein